MGRCDAQRRGLDQPVLAPHRRALGASAPLLDVLAVAGRALPRRLALQLSAAKSRTRALGLGLIRSRISEGERLLASIGARGRAALEAQLLAALEADAGADPPSLHALALRCGLREAALSHGFEAAQRAFSLAFERAAELPRLHRADTGRPRRPHTLAAARALPRALLP